MIRTIEWAAAAVLAAVAAAPLAVLTVFPALSLFGVA